MGDDGVSGNRERIGFGLRLGAFAIDTFATVVIWVALVTIAFLATDHPGGVGNALRALQNVLVESLHWAGLLSVIYLLIEGFTGASPGKMLLEIQILRADGEVADTGTLLFRIFLKGILSAAISWGSVLLSMPVLHIASNVVQWVFTAGCFLALAESKQALHDRILGTAVYQAPGVAGQKSEIDADGR